MFLLADWVAQQTALITNDIRRGSLVHLGPFLRVMRCSFRTLPRGQSNGSELPWLTVHRTLPRIVLLNPGLTVAEAPSHLWAPQGKKKKRKTSSRKWSVISLGSGAGKVLPPAGRTKPQLWAHAQGTAAQFKEVNCVRDMEQTLSGKLDCGYSCFSFKMGQLLISLMYR